MKYRTYWVVREPSRYSSRWSISWAAYRDTGSHRLDGLEEPARITSVDLADPSPKCVHEALVTLVQCWRYWRDEQMCAEICAIADSMEAG